MKIFKYSDIFFRSFVVGLLFYIWINYVLKNFIPSLFLTIFIVFIIELCIYFLKRKNNIKNATKSKESNNFEHQLNTLIISKQKDNVDFFYNIFSNKALYNFDECTKRDNYIVAKKSYNSANDKNNAIKNTEIKIFVVFPYYKFEDLCKSDIITIYNQINTKNIDKINILTNTVTLQDKQFAKCLCNKLNILTFEEQYEMIFKKNNTFPKKTELLSIKKFTFNDFLSYALNKKRTKAYIFSAIFLVLSSYIVIYKVYYLIFATFLFILAFFSYFNVEFNKKQDKDLF